MTTEAAPAGVAGEQQRDVLRWSEIRTWRDRRYRRRPELRLRTEEQAREFVDAVGMSFLFPVAGIDLPSLWEAINGSARPIPDHHYDHALGLCWNWKDSLPERRVVWYGKLLRGKPMFVSLALLPAFYALSENYGDVDDYRQQFADGRMSVEARDVYEVLLAKGPLSTNALRKEAGLYGKGAIAGRFDRAVAELQQDLKIVKCGTSEDNRWKYCYVYDVLLRRFPEVAEAARRVSARQARETLLVRYLDLVAAAPRPALTRLFGWDADTLQRTCDALVTTGRLREVEVRDIPPAAQKPARRAGAPAAPTWLALGPAHGLG